MFEADNPPQKYKLFRKEVIRYVEDLEIEEEDDYEITLFLVSRDYEGCILYAWEIAEAIATEDEEKPDPDDVVYEGIPSAVESFNSKMFALLLPLGIPDEDDEDNIHDMVALLMGDSEHFEVLMSDVEIDEDYDVLELTHWEREHPKEFPQLSVLLRRSVCPQG